MKTETQEATGGIHEVSILGGGNIGMALARGLVSSGRYDARQIAITRRHARALEPIAAEGFRTFTDNAAALQNTKFVVLAVRPRQIVKLLEDIKPALQPDQHIVISLVSDFSIRDIRQRIGADIRVLRAMPNTAIAVLQSMTTLSAAENVPPEVLDEVTALFNAVGNTLLIDEEYMTSATALCACGIAFFLRSIRAASQGGIEIGFHWNEAVMMAAQTAKGAASLLLNSKNHPEAEIDRVTTPSGCTIAGLNELEHRGFSSALIRGIVTSAEKAAKLYHENHD